MKQTSQTLYFLHYALKKFSGQLAVLIIFYDRYSQILLHYVVLKVFYVAFNPSVVLKQGPDALHRSLALFSTRMHVHQTVLQSGGNY